MYSNLENNFNKGRNVARLRKLGQIYFAIHSLYIFKYWCQTLNSMVSIVKTCVGLEAITHRMIEVKCFYHYYSKKFFRYLLIVFFFLAVIYKNPNLTFCRQERTVTPIVFCSSNVWAKKKYFVRLWQFKSSIFICQTGGAESVWPKCSIIILKTRSRNRCQLLANYSQIEY